MRPPTRCAAEIAVHIVSRRGRTYHGGHSSINRYARLRKESETRDACAVAAHIAHIYGETHGTLAETPVDGGHFYT